MAKSNNNTSSVFGSYITSMVSITLVIFLIGVMGVLILSANRISNYVKENIGFSIVMNDDARESDILRLQKYLDATEYVKSSRFVSKELAAKEFSENLGQDFVEFIGVNPLLASIEVHLYADYANPDSLAKIENEFASNPNINKVIYQKDIVHLVNDNINQLSLIVLVFGGLLLLISIALINNTIRLSVYSKRFLIHTMQLVGATKTFIRRPFINKAILMGFVSALLAIALLLALVYYFNSDLGNIFNYKYKELLGVIFGVMILLGVLIAQISSYFAVNKYLRMNTNQLHQY